MKFAWKFWNEIIIQEQYFWEEYRVYVIWWKVVWWLSRIPPFIIWDWIKTIKELVYEENMNPLRWDEPYEKPMVKIKIDENLINYIWLKWYKLDSIIKKWKKIYLSSICNIWVWGKVVDITDELSDDIIKISEEVWKKLWMWIVWIDYLTTDISKPLTKAWWTILEINATPAIFMFYWGENERKIWKNIINLIYNS